MQAIAPLDLAFQIDGTVAAFLIQSGQRVVLVETGPHSCFGALCQQLDAHGLEPADVTDVLLTHIHFDHAGAAWALAAAGSTVHVHPAGLPHLANPERLYRSAERIYGARMEPLWGRMEAIPSNKLRPVSDGQELCIGDLTFRAHHTPGHAKHHIAWQFDDALFTGDVAGVRLGSGPVTPPCPPPDIDIAAWRTSIARMRSIAPKTLWLTHFGSYDDVDRHLDELDTALGAWSAWFDIPHQMGRTAEGLTPEFVAWTNGSLAGLSPDDVRRYGAANPADMSVAGLLRWWDQRGD